MNVKNFLTIAGVLGVVYGLLFFLGTGTANQLYGSTEMATDYSNMILKFFGISIFAGGVLAFMARNASKSIGRMAVLGYMAVSQVLYLVFNIMNATSGNPMATINYVDLVVNAVLGLGAVYFIMQDRKE